MATNRVAPVIKTISVLTWSHRAGAGVKCILSTNKIAIIGPTCHCANTRISKFQTGPCQDFRKCQLKWNLHCIVLHCVCLCNYHNDVFSLDDVL